MFLTDMETHAPDPPDRFTLLRAELRLRFDAHPPMHGIEGALRALLFGLFMYLISLAASLAERQACRDRAGPEPGRPEPRCPEPVRIDAPAGLAAAVEAAADDRPAAAAGPNPGRQAAVSAAVATPRGTPAIDAATHEICIRDESGTHAPCEQRHPTAIAREAGFWKLDSQKPSCEQGSNCVDFVTISKHYPIAAAS